MRNIVDLLFFSGAIARIVFSAHAMLMRRSPASALREGFGRVRATVDLGTGSPIDAVTHIRPPGFAKETGMARRRGEDVPGIAETTGW
jgi:hypothetical protein